MLGSQSALGPIYDSCSFWPANDQCQSPCGLEYAPSMPKLSLDLSPTVGFLCAIE